MRRELKTMTVGQLKRELENQPDDMRIIFPIPTGNHWGNTIAARITCVGSVDVVWSEYLNAFKVLESCSDDRDTETVLILE